MTSDPIPVFFNPTAGRGRAARKIGAVMDQLQNGQSKLEQVASTAPGDIEKLVFDAATSGARTIIVGGGDGSIHEAVNALLRAGTETTLGVLPLGTGNDFAKACGISLKLGDVTADLLARIEKNAVPRRIDAGRMNARYFANGAGIGFDARVSRIAREIRWPRGNLAYLAAVFQGIREGLTTPQVQMRFGELERSGKITLASINNGPWVGGMFPIAPMAENDDGFFDLVFVTPINVARLLTLLPSLISGRHIGAKEVQHHRISSFQLESNLPLPSHLDGEVQPLQKTFSIEMLPAALRVLQGPPIQPHR